MDNSKQIRYRYAKICIFSTVSLSNGRRLARLRDIRTWYGKRGVGCLTLLSCKVTSQGRWGMILAIASPATNEHNSVNCKFRQHLPCTVNGDARGLWIELLTLSISLRLLTKRAPLAKKKRTVGNCGSGENTGSSELNLHRISWIRHISELNDPDN